MASPGLASNAPQGWVGIAQARALPGLRLLALRGVPSPWSMAARAILDLKKIPYVKVCVAPDDAPGALLEWTGQASFPAAMYQDERPRAGWAEILLLAERLAPEPPLLPADPEERALVLGVSHEICGEMGLAWCRRLLMLEARMRAAPDDSQVATFLRKYGSGDKAFEGARARLVEVLRMLGSQLQRQREAGRAFLVGGALSAADVYWATFSNMVALLPPERLPLPDPLRAAFSLEDSAVAEALHPALIRHRDWIYERYLRTPVEL